MSVQVNDADSKKIQELFAKEHQCMTAQMQVHIRKVNSMFADERKKVRERYKEYEDCYLGHYVQWFVWFFFVLGFFGFCSVIAVMIAQHYGKWKTLDLNVLKARRIYFYYQNAFFIAFLSFSFLCFSSSKSTFVGFFLNFELLIVISNS